MVQHAWQPLPDSPPYEAQCREAQGGKVLCYAGDRADAGGPVQCAQEPQCRQEVALVQQVRMCVLHTSMLLGQWHQHQLSLPLLGITLPILPSNSTVLAALGCASSVESEIMVVGSFVS